MKRTKKAKKKLNLDLEILELESKITPTPVCGGQCDVNLSIYAGAEC